MAELAPRIASQLQRLAVPIESLTLHPRNPRRGDLATVAASLARFGQLKPVVVQERTKFVVAGNHLLAAARSLGWTEIAATIQPMDDATATAFMLADNRTSDLSGYDDALLAAILAEANESGNLAATGYDADVVAALLAAAEIADRRGDPDSVPDLPTPAEVYVTPGSLWALGRHRLLTGDSTIPADVARLTDDVPVDLVWTDPPWNQGYSGKTPAALTIANDDLGAAATRTLIADALRLAPLRAGGAFYVATPTGRNLLTFLLALADVGWHHRQTLIWVKDRFTLGRSDYQLRHEGILYGWADGASHAFVADRTQDTIWEIPRPARSAVHPTMKPVALVERAIRNSTAPGDFVYDPFAGSGSTLMAAEISDRTCLAIELEPRYAQVIIERWQTFTGHTAERLR